MMSTKVADLKQEMYTIIGSIKELEDCNIIACHLTTDKFNKSKITIIADDISKNIIKVDIFIRNNDLVWEIRKNVY